MQLHSAYLAGWVHPADVFVQFYAAEPSAFWLDREFAAENRFSVMGAGNPIPNSRITNQDEVTRALARMEFYTNLDLPFDWRPGLVGTLTYEGEERFLEASRAMVFDHQSQGMYFIGLFECQSDFDFWHHAALLRLGLSGGQVANYLHAQPSELSTATSSLRHSADDYLAMIRAYCAAHGVRVPDDRLQAEAIEWQATRGGRSGRVAWQFFCDLAAREGVRIRL